MGRRHLCGRCVGEVPITSRRYGRAGEFEEAESTEKEKEVWTVEMMASIGWKMTWYEQAEAWVEEEEAWIVASPAYLSSASLQLGRTS